MDASTRTPPTADNGGLGEDLCPYCHITVVVQAEVVCGDCQANIQADSTNDPA